MHRVGITALALAALVSAAPISEPSKTVDQRDFIVPDPNTWLPGSGNPPPPFFTFLPPITGGLEPSTKKRQDTVIVLPPISGGLEPSDKKKRQDTIGIGDGSSTDPVKAHIKALELEYEALIHNFGAHPPKPIAKRITAIQDELLSKYGIKIVQSPDGTTTIFVPGKKRSNAVPVDGDSFPGGPFFPFPGFPGPITPDPVVPGGPIKVSD
ncbi:uncharacterized protein F4812DRAFT_313830 [Daldinia caldariorum]|uniref:uncharacterized protein n=1 Tax=Daldinia caldariorum TaxID=326644 RepID=UPI002007C856|nr:uncharacterized protein F4812DRAFT_313830 [Daldinia caldariorum]KAI1470094.1 hypothetical protein F4812DRAFT_313830 [Daldinia caldariorum]